RYPHPHPRPPLLHYSPTRRSSDLELFVTLSDKGQLHQESETEEQKKKNEILQKVVLPLIRGSVRIEGSKFDARDFISQRSDRLRSGDDTSELQSLTQLVIRLLLDI